MVTWLKRVDVREISVGPSLPTVVNAAHTPQRHGSMWQGTGLDGREEPELGSPPPMFHVSVTLSVRSQSEV